MTAARQEGGRPGTGPAVVRGTCGIPSEGGRPARQPAPDEPQFTPSEQLHDRERFAAPGR